MIKLRSVVLVAFIALLFSGCLGLAEEQAGYPPVASRESPLASPGAGSYDSQYVAKQGSVTLKVAEGSLQGSYEELREALKDDGAILSDVNYNEYGERKQYSFSIKILPSKFDAVMSAIQAYGEVKDISVQLEDVTQQYVELDLKIANREAELARLQELYNRSDSVSDLIEVERELTRVETDLEILKQQKQNIVSRVEYSTITVNIYEEKPAISRLTLSLETLGALFFGAIAAAITLIVLAVGFLLPIGIIAVLAFLAYKKAFGRKPGPKPPEHKKIPLPD